MNPNTKYLKELTNQNRADILDKIKKLPIEKQHELILVGLDYIMSAREYTGTNKVDIAFDYMLSYVADVNESFEYLRSIGIKEEDL